jgi:formylglycine-generating enzyme required for sulfatase activity
MRRRSDNQIVLIDFGAVKEISVLTTNQKGATTLTVAVGTLGYMPSEQNCGKPKLSSDIYAVGMVGIKALTGKDPESFPTDQNTGNIIWRNEAQVSKYLADILDKMVHQYFPQRYDNATEALKALNIQNNKTRRQILILGGLAGSGFVGALLIQRFNKPSPENIPTSELIPETPPKNISTPQPTPSPTPSPRLKFPIETFTTVTVNSRGEIISRPQGQAELMTENIGNGVSLEMVKIPGGRFLMGSPETEAERRSSEGPQHYVDVPEFFMGKYAVTQGQWEAVMGNNPSRFKGASRPVEKVSWYDATKFCQKLSQITGKKYSLPSESQWEYACRAGTTTPFYFGETITSELVNYDGDYTYADAPEGIYRKETTNVGIFPPNAFGLYDMHGNVWEWCADEWHSNYDGAPTDSSVWLDGDKDRSPLRGGSWAGIPINCRSAIRNIYYRRDDHIILSGFRVVCDGGRTL